MIGAMPRPKLPFTHLEVTRHGEQVWYFRRGKRKRIRLRAKFGTPEFEAEYTAALSGAPVAPRGNVSGPSGSLQWVWTRYRQSGAWTSLSPATRRQRETVMAKVLKVSGSVPCIK